MGLLVILSPIGVIVGFCFLLTGISMSVSHPKYADMPYEERTSKARKYLLAGISLILVPPLLTLLILY